MQLRSGKTSNNPMTPSSIPTNRSSDAQPTITPSSVPTNQISDAKPKISYLDPSASLQAVFTSFMQQQQQTNQVMSQLLLQLCKESKTDEPAVSAQAPATKTYPIFSSELGTADIRSLSDDDRLIVRSFKFFSFRARFTKLTRLLGDDARLQHLYCCLVGQAQERAVLMIASTSEELFGSLAERYASAADPGALEDSIRHKLECSVPFPTESLAEYVSRFDQYYRFAKEVSPNFSISEPTCCRLFLHSLRSRTALFSAMVYASGRKVSRLEDIFSLARDTETRFANKLRFF
uniref:Retrotransposon gag domain-containing protein n=1 Tax=Spongospora subterranea TaxID=70186 RepID=A0A0H5R173_9EUKA|eukprot:CRZ07968.1 hypothetical protein [Spongospora subterranea]